MGHNSGGVAALLLLASLASAQSTARPRYLDRAVIQHRGRTTTLTANYPTPLFQAIDGIREEYGWQVNWEEAPCYSHFDVVDDTSPKWRAAHPGAEGVTRKSGGLFATTFPEPETGEATAERETLRKVIADYNATGNPGKYALRAGPGEPFTVVGTEVTDDSGILQTVVPILDLPISVNAKPRSATDALDAILQALTLVSGKRVILMSLPNNLFRDTQVNLGGHDVAARQLLQDLLRSMPRTLQYDLGFDPDHASVYILNISATAKAEVDQEGRRLLGPSRRPAVRWGGVGGWRVLSSSYESVGIAIANVRLESKGRKRAARVYPCNSDSAFLASPLFGLIFSARSSCCRASVG